MMENRTKKPTLLFFAVLIFSAFPIPAFPQEENFLSVPRIGEKIARGIEIQVGERNFVLSPEDLSGWTREKSILIFDPDYRSEIENFRICEREKSLVCEIIFTEKKSRGIKKFSSLEVSKNSIQDYLETLAVKTEKGAEEAKFKMEDGKVSVFSLGKDGGEIDEEKSLDIIFSWLQSEDFPEKIELSWKKISFDISPDSLDNMGIDTLIGQGKSNFRGSPKNRVHNIRVGTEKFNGILIKPGEEFSFVKILGEVDGENGYLPELVIKKDKTEPEFGGGICQVSTTIFRAAVHSGLEITARRNHAYPVQYYSPQGMDATVYIPRPDLRFKNNTPGHILVQPKIEGTELVFDFYGTSDGRKVEVIGPKIIERRPDGGMKTVFTQKVSDKDGNMIMEEVFSSNYDSPSKYPHPGTTSDILTEKPKSWSDKEWRKYKKSRGI